VLTGSNADAVAAICAYLDGLPLAIELAAVSIRLLSPQQLLDQLTGSAGSAFKLLKGQVRDAAIQHQTLRQAFQWSYDLLDAGARLLFGRLSVFINSWTLEAADAVCDIGDLLSGSTDPLASLLDNCLIQKEPSSNGERSEYRFTMLTTLREFALDRLSANGEGSLLRQRHADYFLTFAKLAEPEITGRNQISWLERVEENLGNFRTALDWTIDSSPDQALQLAVALFPFWHARSLLSEGRHYFDQVLAKTQARTPLRGRALAAAGLLAQRQGDLAEAEELINASVRLCFDLGDQSGLAYALNNLAIVVMSKGENSLALQDANDSLAICQDPDYPLGMARAQMIIGQIALNGDRLETSRQALEASLFFWRQKGDLKNEILCQINLGRLFLLLGDFNKATIFLEESLDLSRKIKDQHWELLAAWNLAEIQLRKSAPDEAGIIFEDCLEKSRRLGDRYFEAMTLNRLGQVAAMQGNPQMGMPLFRASLEIGRQTGSKWVAADGLLQLGRAALQLEDQAAAQASFMESLRLFYEQGEQSDIVLNLELLALMYQQRSQPDFTLRLLGAASAWRSAAGIPQPGQYQTEQDQVLKQLQSQLSPDAYS